MKSAILRLLDFFWMLLPGRVKVHLIQSKNNTGLLDAPGDILMRLESKDSLSRLHSCGKEPDTIKWLHTMKSSDILYDVGANVGAYSLYAARVIGSKVYSFEPSPSTFRLLLENIHLNKLGDKIIPYNAPLSSSTEQKIFRYNSLSSGSASHAGLENGHANGNLIEQPVLTLSLTDLVTRFGAEMPNYMKIDVDGHELGILQGADAVLKSPKLRSIQVELSIADSNYQAIVDILANYGYRINHVNKHPHSPSTDIVFVK